MVVGGQSTLDHSLNLLLMILDRFLFHLPLRSLNAIKGPKDSRFVQFVDLSGCFKIDCKISASSCAHDGRADRGMQLISLVHCR